MESPDCQTGVGKSILLEFLKVWSNLPLQSLIVYLVGVISLFRDIWDIIELWLTLCKRYLYLCVYVNSYVWYLVFILDLIRVLDIYHVLLYHFRISFIHGVSAEIHLTLNSVTFSFSLWTLSCLFSTLLFTYEIWIDSVMWVVDILLLLLELCVVYVPSFLIKMMV